MKRNATRPDKSISEEGDEHRMAESQSIKRALTASTGEVYTVERGHSSITIGRAEPLPTDDVDDQSDECEYPEVPRRDTDYDTWLG